MKYLFIHLFFQERDEIFYEGDNNDFFFPVFFRVLQVINNGARAAIISDSDRSNNSDSTRCVL